MSHFPPVDWRDLDPFFSSRDKDFWLSSSWSRCCARPDTSCWIIEAHALKHTTLLFLPQPPHLCGHMINYSTPGWCHFTMLLLPALLLFKTILRLTLSLFLIILFLLNESASTLTRLPYWCIFKDHRHRNTLMTRTCFCQIWKNWWIYKTYKWFIMELLSHRSDTQRAASSWKVGSVGPVGPLPWFFQCCLRFSLNQLVIPDSMLP